MAAAIIDEVERPGPDATQVNHSSDEAGLQLPLMKFLSAPNGAIDIPRIRCFIAMSSSLPIQRLGGSYAYADSSSRLYPGRRNFFGCPRDVSSRWHPDTTFGRTG